MEDGLTGLMVGILLTFVLVASCLCVIDPVEDRIRMTNQCQVAMAEQNLDCYVHSVRLKGGSECSCIRADGTKLIYQLGGE